MVIFDTTFLTFLFVPNAKCGVERARERVDFVISDLHGEGEKVGIPTPVLSEILIKTGHSTQQIVSDLTKGTRFQILPFDTIAAIEAAEIAIDAQKKGPKRGDSKETWAKVKYDRQIVAIARVHKARIIYSDDPGLRNLAESLGIAVKGIAECQLPYRQVSMNGSLFGEDSHEFRKTQTAEAASAVQGSSSGLTQGQAGAKGKDKA
jgi:predicted nucleic acid-binding protein